MFYVDDLEGEFKRINELGIEITTEIESKPWGVKVFTFRDPDGHGVHFLEKL
ncbi:glyoxalase/bleomycin resistance/extradiol dioxygenase family protein [Acidaminobacter sp. JC074]|uniref:VOC family protein n=1 Tax=Acidaminobacter sp. JC074 TaxID=2530199 RepID=UPI001F0E03CE|nr:VOC family protein [Acidaminobacter sp. JC074]